MKVEKQTVRFAPVVITLESYQELKDLYETIRYVVVTKGWALPGAAALAQLLEKEL